MDAGCGGGAFVEFLAAKGLSVTGLDYHDMFLNVARARSGVKGTYVQGDITALPFPDQHFDCTYCFDVLEHVDDAKALAELVRVTRKRVIIAVPATDSGEMIGGGLTFHHYRDLTHLRTYTVESLQSLVAAVGQQKFEIIPELPVNLHLFVTEILQPAQSSNPLKRLGRKVYNLLMRWLLRYARFPNVRSGYAVVIDLPPGASSAPQP